jgi:hypothetical protein
VSALGGLSSLVVLMMLALIHLVALCSANLFEGAARCKPTVYV